MIHAFFARRYIGGVDRFTRRRRDLAHWGKLDRRGRAVTNRSVDQAAPSHETVFFPERDRDDRPIDYDRCQGNLAAGARLG